MNLKKYRGERRRKSKSISSKDKIPNNCIAVLNSKFYLSRQFIDQFHIGNKHMGFSQDQKGNWYFYLSYDPQDIELTVYRFSYYFFYQSLADKLRKEFAVENNFFISLDEPFTMDRMILFPFKSMGNYPEQINKIDNPDFQVKNIKNPNFIKGSTTKNSSVASLLLESDSSINSFYDILTSYKFHSNVR